MNNKIPVCELCHSTDVEAAATPSRWDAETDTWVVDAVEIDHLFCNICECDVKGTWVTPESTIRRTVRIEIDVWEPTPQAAALRAWELLKEADGPVCDVIGSDGSFDSIDLKGDAS